MCAKPRSRQAPLNGLRIVLLTAHAVANDEIGELVGCGRQQVMQ
jgi:hypothetical protein